MSGGVSLAIWMGGATREIYAFWLASQFEDRGRDQLVPPDLKPYHRLLELARATVAIDVVAGASAGGVNGILLGAAMSRRSPLSIVQDFRDVWITAASPDILLRDLTEKEPPSLLKGNEEYLPRLQQVLDRILKEESVGDAARGLKLVVTATDLQGRGEEVEDDFGHRFHDRRHTATFTFERSHLDGGSTHSGELAAALALAGRTTSSFPLAFEPSYIRIGEATGTLDADAPDMGPYSDLDQSRFMVDGGVLNNKPVDLALDEVWARPAVGLDRRLVLLLEPDPAKGVVDRPDNPAKPPPLGSVIWDSAVAVPRKLNIAAALEEINQRNDLVRARRSARNWAATDLIGHPAAAAPVGSSAILDKAYGRFRQSRIDRTIGSLVGRVVQVHPNLAAGHHLACRQRVKAVIDDLSADEESQILPERFPTEATNLLGPEDDRQEWRYTLAPIGYLLNLVNDYLRLALSRTDKVDIAGPMVTKHRELVDLLIEIDELGRAYWQLIKANEASRELKLDDLENWVRDCWVEWPIVATTELGQHVADSPAKHRYDATRDRVVALASQVWPSAHLPSGGPTPKWIRQRMTDVAGAAAEQLCDLAPLLPTEEAEAASAATALTEWASGDPTTDQRNPVDAGEVIRRVLWLYVLESGLTGEASPRSLGAPIDWMLLSSEVESPLAPQRNGGAKLAGIQLAHFGAFLKRSWRANDWMWGRLDGAASISRALFTTDRLAQLLAPTKTVGTYRAARVFHEDLTEFIGGTDGWDAVDAVSDEARSLIEAGRDSFATTAWKALHARTAGDDGKLRDLAAQVAELVAARLQTDVAADELPAVADAIAHDHRSGIPMGADASEFRNKVIDNRTALGGKVGAERTRLAASLLDSCRVGVEGMGELSTTPAFGDTVATAAAVVVSAGATQGSGPRSASQMLSLVRLPSKVFAVLARAARTSSSTTIALVTMVLTAAVVVVVGRLAGASVPAVVTLLAGSVLAATVLLTWLRLGTSLLGWAGGALLLLAAALGGAGLARTLVATETTAVYRAPAAGPLLVTLDEEWAALGARLRCTGSAEGDCGAEGDGLLVRGSATFAVDAFHTGWVGGAELECADLIDSEPVDPPQSGTSDSVACSTASRPDTARRERVTGTVALGAGVVGSTLTILLARTLGTPAEIPAVGAAAASLGSKGRRRSRQVRSHILALVIALPIGGLAAVVVGVLYGPGLEADHRDRVLRFLGDVIWLRPVVLVVIGAVAVFLVVRSLFPTRRVSPPDKEEPPDAN